MKKVLVVDDNDKYAEQLFNYLQKLNYEVLRAKSAREGWEIFEKEKTSLDGIITDVTMETQTSGLWMIRRVYKSGYEGKLIMASTGFDVWGVMQFSYFLLAWFFGIQWMIPKVPLKKGIVQWVPTVFGKGNEIPYA